MFLRYQNTFLIGREYCVCLFVFQIISLHFNIFLIKLAITIIIKLSIILTYAECFLISERCYCQLSFYQGLSNVINNMLGLVMIMRP